MDSNSSQESFIEHLLYSRTWSRHWGYARKQDRLPRDLVCAFREQTFLWGSKYITEQGRWCEIKKDDEG